jgi:hypothetical protein
MIGIGLRDEDSEIMVGTLVKKHSGKGGKVSGHQKNARARHEC